MSKIHLAPANIQTGLPLAGKEEPCRHPNDEDVKVLYISIENWLEHNEHHVGDLLAYFKAVDYKDNFHDRSLPYGTHCIRGTYTLRHGGYIYVTGKGTWEWVRDSDGEIFTGHPHELINNHTPKV